MSARSRKASSAGSSSTASTTSRKATSSKSSRPARSNGPGLTSPRRRRRLPHARSRSSERPGDREPSRLDAVASRRLSHVQGTPREANQRISVPAVGREARDPEARGQPPINPVHSEGPDASPQLLGEDDGAVPVGLGQQDEELLAAVAAGNVARA